MIYFVSYVLGLARENSENAISDHLETPNFRNFLKCSAFISAQQPFTTKSSPRKNNILQSGPSPPDGRNFLYGRSVASTLPPLQNKCATWDEFLHGHLIIYNWSLIVTKIERTWPSGYINYLNQILIFSSPYTPTKSTSTNIHNTNYLNKTSPPYFSIYPPLATLAGEKPLK
jgi:hypothetical protein